MILTNKKMIKVGNESIAVKNHCLLCIDLCSNLAKIVEEEENIY